MNHLDIGGEVSCHARTFLSGIHNGFPLKACGNDNAASRGNVILKDSIETISGDHYEKIDTPFSISILLVYGIFNNNSLCAGPSHYNWGSFTRADSLRGYLSPLRTCYDVTYYHLDISINPDSQSIQGSNTIRFKVVNAFNKMQVDLFANMNVDSIILEDGTILKYSREFGAVFINMPRELEQNTEHQIVFYYSGRPQVAKNPPWDGGFIWKKDKSRSLLSQKEYAGSRKAGQGNPWVMVTCQGTGASLWWPNKDHQSAEPDSMLLSVTIPKGLEDISNGRLRSEVELARRTYTI